MEMSEKLFWCGTLVVLEYIVCVGCSGNIFPSEAPNVIYWVTEYSIG